MHDDPNQRREPGADRRRRERTTDTIARYLFLTGVLLVVLPRLLEVLFDDG